MVSGKKMKSAIAVQQCPSYDNPKWLQAVNVSQWAMLNSKMMMPAAFSGGLSIPGFPAEFVHLQMHHNQFATCNNYHRYTD